MKLCIDFANVEQISRLYKIYNIDGVSTNPSILAKENRPPYEVLHEIRDIVGEQGLLFVQALGQDVDTIGKEAAKICEELGDNTIIKIPCTEVGLQAIKTFSSQYHILGTAVYTTMQAYLAAKNGAEWVAPYVNRITKFGGDGIATTKQIQNLFETNEMDCKILAASFKKVEQITELTEYGIAAATLAPAVFDMLTDNPLVDEAVADFTSDFERLTSSGANMTSI